MGMFAKCNVFSAFDLLLSLDFKFVKIKKKTLKIYFRCDFPHLTQCTL